jgi:hypothetical protein
MRWWAGAPVHEHQGRIRISIESRIHPEQFLIPAGFQHLLNRQNHNWIVGAEFHPRGAPMLAHAKYTASSKGSAMGQELQGRKHVSKVPCDVAEDKQLYLARVALQRRAKRVED